MAFDYSAIMQAQYERIEADHAAAVAELEQARYIEDSAGTHAAATRILQLDAERSALAQRANQFIAQQQAGPMIPGSEDMPRRDVELCRKYGVTPNELGIAKNWTSDPKLSDDAKVQGYIEQRQRYRHARATGSYRDDQGFVRR